MFQSNFHLITDMKILSVFVLLLLTKPSDAKNTKGKCKTHGVLDFGLAHLFKKIYGILKLFFNGS